MIRDVVRNAAAGFVSSEGVCDCRRPRCIRRLNSAPPPGRRTIRGGSAHPSMCKKALGHGITAEHVRLAYDLKI